MPCASGSCSPWVRGSSAATTAAAAVRPSAATAATAAADSATSDDTQAYDEWVAKMQSTSPNSAAAIREVCWE